jgi:Glucose / Sorbosone dehydrogenase
MLYLVVDGVVTPYLDVGSTFEPDFFASVGMGSGFGFVTFHPEFAQNGKFYTTHTEADAALQNALPDLTPQPRSAYHGVITEWIAEDPAANTFKGTSREVLRLGFRARIHHIQQISFNPTATTSSEDYGLLYLGVGDGGNGARSDEPQDLTTPQGKILRIDPAGNDSDNFSYGIPAGNPFVSDPAALGEIYAYGLRDPHRFSWDSAGEHRMFLASIGEHDIETLYDVLPGDNFGWSEREGRFVRNKSDPCNLYPLPADDARFGYVYPLAEYGHERPPELGCRKDAGHAISGGFMYRGPVESLRGKYIFGDLVDGRVMYVEESEMRRERARSATIHLLKVIDPAGKEMTVSELVGDKRTDLRFGTDAANNLYLLSKANGKIWKVTGAR